MVLPKPTIAAGTAWLQSVCCDLEPNVAVCAVSVPEWSTFYPHAGDNVFFGKQLCKFQGTVRMLGCLLPLGHKAQEYGETAGRPSGVAPCYGHSVVDRVPERMGASPLL